jgi:predicted DNA-binding transcriptional regulator AlpA
LRTQFPGIIVEFANLQISVLFALFLEAHFFCLHRMYFRSNGFSVIQSLCCVAGESNTVSTTFGSVGRRRNPDAAKEPGGKLSDYILQSQAVEEYPFSRRTWQHWRETGAGPKGRRIGRHVVYRRADIEEWLASHFEEVAK